MINACLPSTLVRCIYLFLDLPEEHKTPALIEHVPREHVYQLTNPKHNCSFIAFSQVSRNSK